jgi:hypothetical protein
MPLKYTSKLKLGWLSTNFLVEKVIQSWKKSSSSSSAIILRSPAKGMVSLSCASPSWNSSSLSSVILPLLPCPISLSSLSSFISSSSFFLSSSASASSSSLLLLSSRSSIILPSRLYGWSHRP